MNVENDNDRCKYLLRTYIEMDENIRLDFLHVINE